MSVHHHPCPVTSEAVHAIGLRHGFVPAAPDPVIAALAAPDPFDDLGLLAQSVSEIERALSVAAARLPIAAAHLLEAQGVPRRFVAQLTGVGAIGLAAMSVNQRSGLWSFDGAERRLVLAVREQGVLTDLVALRSTDADEWVLLRGAGWVLGHERIREARIMGEGVLRVFGTPMAWLAGEGRGICVLDWSRDVTAKLRGLGPGVTFQCDSPASREALLRVLRWRDLPGVEVVSADNERVAA